jgi:selenocysteine lyase/cysteine desulfurase
LPKDCNVVSTDADFPSVVYPWKRLASEHGFEVRLACNRDGVISEEELEKLVDNKTRVISISHVEYGTGQKFDLGKLAELAHTHDALLVVDATQSAGLVPIDVHREDVDVLVAGGYKGLLGPFGAAILYVRQDLVDEVMPPFAGWRSTPIPYALDATKLDFAPGARKFEYSTMSYASAVGLSASMLYLKKLGSDVTKRVAELVDGMIEGVRETERLSGTLLLTPTEENSRASIASFRFKDLDQNTIALELVRKRVIVSQRFNGVRFSFHAYNSKEDVTHAIDSLSEIVAMTS